MENWDKKKMPKGWVELEDTELLVALLLHITNVKLDHWSTSY